MVRQWLLDKNGVGYQNPEWRQTPEFLELYAKVLEREAEARPHDAFAQRTFREWAANARRRAAALEPVQGDLFGEVS